jgi:hypothetical protein
VKAQNLVPLLKEQSVAHSLGEYVEVTTMVPPSCSEPWIWPKLLKFTTMCSLLFPLSHTAHSVAVLGIAQTLFPKQHLPDPFQLYWEHTPRHWCSMILWTPFSSRRL